MKPKLMSLTFLVFFLISCSGDEGEVTNPPAEDVIRIITTGEQVYKDLITTLSSALMSAMDTDGEKGAITTCNIDALPITESIYKNNPEIIDIKRTSFKIRNRKNKPDRFEKRALHYFEELIANGKELPSYRVQKITRKNDAFYRYYKPLIINDLCLKCHGPTDRMSADILQKLGELYPDDEAHGYSANDFRGIVSISLSGNVQE